MEFIISLLPFLLIIAVMYFLMIRPQKKRADETKEMLNKLGQGDSIVTIGGLHGVIDEINDSANTVVLDCEGIYLTFERRAIGRVLAKAENSNVNTDVTADDLGTNTPEDTADNE